MSCIDFDLSSIRGVAFDVDGVLSPSTVPMGSDGIPLRMVNIKDGYALQLAASRGLQLAVITGGRCPGLEARYNALGVKDVYTGVSKKLPIFQEWLALRGLHPSQVAYMGDDIPDYEVMRTAGLSVAPVDAAVDIKRIADYISPVEGGYGVARDLLEQILRAQGAWMSSAEAFGW